MRSRRPSYAHPHAKPAAASLCASRLAIAGCTTCLKALLGSRPPLTRSRSEPSTYDSAVRASAHCRRHLCRNPQGHAHRESRRGRDTRILARSGLDGSELGDVVMGQVVQTGAKMNPARQAAINADVPVNVAAMTIDRVCSSGAQAIVSAGHEVMSGLTPRVSPTHWRTAQHAVLRNGPKLRRRQAGPRPIQNMATSADECARRIATMAKEASI